MIVWTHAALVDLLTSIQMMLDYHMQTMCNVQGSIDEARLVIMGIVTVAIVTRETPSDSHRL